MIDYHTHTSLCNHAEGTPAEYLAAAESAGLQEIGVSDHFPWPVGFDPKWRMRTEEFSVYRQIVEDMRRLNSPVRVRYAIEADWVSGRMDEALRILAGEPFDYIIGSIHYADDLPFDDPDEKKAVWEVEGREEWIWHRYYELMLEMVCAGCFNIIGHFDLPKKFGSVQPESQVIARSLRDIMAAAEGNKMAIEINTAGLRKPAGACYPGIEILKLAATAGVMLTFGSDAHSPSEVGANFADAIELARQAGFKEYCSFDQKKPIMHKLP